MPWKLSILFSIILISCKSNLQLQNDVRLSNDTITFGIINYEDTLEFFEKIYNNSDKKIKIIAIEPSCGCTSIIVQDSFINPLDSLNFLIKYVPKDSQDSGGVKKLITIRTDGSTIFSSLVLIGKVKKIK